MRATSFVLKMDKTKPCKRSNWCAWLFDLTLLEYDLALRRHGAGCRKYFDAVKKPIVYFQDEITITVVEVVEVVVVVVIID